MLIFFNVDDKYTLGYGCIYFLLDLVFITISAIRRHEGTILSVFLISLSQEA